MQSRCCRWAALVLIILMARPLAAPVEAEGPSPGNFVAGRILVKPRPGVLATNMVAPLANGEVRVSGEVPELSYVILSVPDGTELEWVQRLASSPLVAHAQPEYIYSILRDPNDFWYFAHKSDDALYQWNLRTINAPSAWDISTGSSDITIAIVDTGVDERHEDLAGKVVLKADFINEDNPFDGLGFHATHVAGIAAAKTNNATGIAAVSWGAGIMSVKVANHFGKAPDTAAAQGIIYAADHGANIMNLSFGGEDYSQMMQDAVNYAYNKGILIVAAAGNCADPPKLVQYDCKTLNAPIYPAAGQNVLAVGAINVQNQRSAFSEYGSYVAVVAPGEDILSTTPNQGYARTSGTSMAAPHVSALASLIWSVNPSLTNAQVANIITSTTVNLGPPGKDDEYGYGLIDARAALVKASEPPPTPTPTPPTPTPVSSVVVNPSTAGVLARPNEADVITRSLSISTGTANLFWSAAVPTPSAWLSISPTTGQAPSNIVVSMDPNNRGPGVYQNSIRINAPGAQPSQTSVTVTLTLTDTILYGYVPVAMTGWAGGW